MKPELSKKLLLVLSLILFSVAGGFAQKGCKNLFADLDKGTLNGVKPTAEMKLVKKKLPCFTGDSPEDEVYNCGGGVFYLKHDFFCYTGKDYIEVRGNFKGKASQDVLGKTAAEIVTLLGEPDMKIDGYETKDNWLYRKSYGTLRITFDEEGSVRNFGMHAVAPEKVELCL